MGSESRKITFQFNRGFAAAERASAPANGDACIPANFPNACRPHGFLPPRPRSCSRPRTPLRTFPLFFLFSPVAPANPLLAPSTMIGSKPCFRDFWVFYPISSIFHGLNPYKTLIFHDFYLLESQSIYLGLIYRISIT